LIIVYHCLVGAGKQKTFKTELVDKILNDVKNIWIQIEEENEGFLKENSWARYTAKVLSISDTPPHFRHNQDIIYKLAMKFLKHWIKKNMKDFEGVKYNEQVYVDFINQLIYVANHKSLPF
jgi:hypothetical protein